MQNKRNRIDKRLLVFIIGAIILPITIEQIVLQGYNIQFEDVIWYDVLHTIIFLFVSVPFFIYILKQSDRYANKLEYQLMKNEKITEDLTEKTLELSNMAYYDHLTGLPNRHKLFEVLEMLIEMNKSETRKIGVLFLYIDQFKIINDVIGHELGDDYILLVSEKLHKRLPLESLVSRYSSNEFIILLSDTNETEYAKVASHIIELFSKPLLLGDEEIYATASMGISLYPYHGEDAKTLIKHADIAMYLSKSDNGSTYQFYSSKLDEDTDRTIKLVKGLKLAIDEEQLILHYQPQINLDTGDIMGLEALVRWNHPEFGFIQPDEFISLAEETGEIVSIGKWVLLEACRQTKYWQNTYFSELEIAVNVSVRQLEEPDFVDVIIDVLDETGLDPAYLEIEITESMVQDLEESYAIFNKLKEIGVNMVIDDFGTGYSSLNVLGFLPIDYLKIDRSFTRDMLIEQKINSIVKTIINMGESLQVKLIAEGIEEAEQLHLLKKYGCHVGQGYYFSKPVSATEIEEKWLHAKFPVI